jgi:hypothetical protein
MSWANAVSLACLVITGSLATWAVFSHHFDDTLVQRVGLSIVAMGCTTRAYDRITTLVPEPPPALLWSQVGLALYAMGTAWRLYRQGCASGQNRRRPRARRGLMSM